MISKARVAYIGIGSNLQWPEEQVTRAIAALGTLPDSRLLRASSLYRSAPVGYLDQPDFVNAVAELETALGARELLAALLDVERRFGRVREFPNAPRTLDLDVLLHGDEELREAGLTVPHPRLHERAFVLAPLAELAPDLEVPGRGRVRDLLTAVGQAGTTRLEPAQR